jgi:hypothetical protein
MRDVHQHRIFNKVGTRLKKVKLVPEVIDWCDIWESNWFRFHGMWLDYPKDATLRLPIFKGGKALRRDILGAEKRRGSERTEAALSAIEWPTDSRGGPEYHQGPRRDMLIDHIF